MATHPTSSPLCPADFCSSLKITDQSNQKVCCTLFREKLDDHPKIFQIGDIIRLHRVKVWVSYCVDLKIKLLLFHGAFGSNVWMLPSLRLSSSMTPSLWSTPSVSRR